MKKVVTAFSMLLAITWAAAALADVRLPHIIGDRMVLQQDMPLPIWGWANPEETVTVTLGDTNQQVTHADSKGNWRVNLAPMKAGGPYTMTISGKNTLTLNDILVGEVWIGSGQSNMQMNVQTVQNAKEEMAAANYPDIRLFLVPTLLSGMPNTDLPGQWVKCSPATIPSFASALYFFGREIHQQTKLPVGLIASSWGGSPIEAWIPAVGYGTVDQTKDMVKKIEDAHQTYIKECEKALADGRTWLKQTKAIVKNAPLMPEAVPLVMPQHPLSGWGAPTSMYNAMIHPLIPFAVRGAIWYQGESNILDGMLYAHKMRALIQGWRELWGQKEFSFYWAQIAPYNYGSDATRLPRLWEAQAAAMGIPDTGMAVLTDIGNINDIHPLNKQEVGRRLALWALKKNYGKDVVCSGPLYKAMKVDGNRVILQFDYSVGLKSSDGKDLRAFEVFDDTRVLPATATIDGDTVVVSNKDIANPIGARFAWSQYADPNLVNGAGLPACPFQTGCDEPVIAGNPDFADVTTVELIPQDYGSEIHYTLDGKNPDLTSPKYEKPIDIKKTCTLKARAFRDGSRKSIVVAATFTKVEPRQFEGKTLVPGVRYDYYEGNWPAIPPFDKLSPVKSGITQSISLTPRARDYSFAMRFTGFLEISQPGPYTFELTCDDGGKLMIDGKTVVDLDGLHGSLSARGTVELTAGMHSVTVGYLQNNGGYSLSVAYEAPNMPQRNLPLWCEKK